VRRLRFANWLAGLPFPCVRLEAVPILVYKKNS
jgi:hypothetical protein